MATVTDFILGGSKITADGDCSHEITRAVPGKSGLCARGEGERALAPHERLPEIPVVPREKIHTCATTRENPQDAPVIAS